MAVSDEQVARINFLARKARTEGLSEAEREEQATLRQAYVAAVRASLSGILDTIRVVQVDEFGQPIDETVDIEVDAGHAKVEAVILEPPPDEANPETP